MATIAEAILREVKAARKEIADLKVEVEKLRSEIEVDDGLEKEEKGGERGAEKQA